MRDIRKFDFAAKELYRSRPFSEPRSSRFLWGGFSIIVVLISVLPAVVAAQQPHSQIEKGVTIQGSVRNSAGQPIADASVSLEQEGTLRNTKTTTTAAGAFVFTALPPGHYLLSAEKFGQKSRRIVDLASARGDRKNIDLILPISADTGSNSGVPSPSPPAMEFADKPNFTIAGVTDWTAAGGHGSDGALRTSEDLARETLMLKADGSNNRWPASSVDRSKDSESESRLRAALANAPGSFDENHQLGEFYFHSGRYQESIPLLQAAYRINAAMDDNTYDLVLAYKEAGDFSKALECLRKLQSHKDSADLHRLAGELDERLGDPLAAVHEDELAVHLDPSEQNYFAWGSELLLHRAVWQAVEVFRSGVRLYPKSSRMLTALGTSLFGVSLYDDAALQLCDASDLNPAAPEPYIFMGRIEKEAPAPLPCIQQRLARFLHEQPGSSLANYLYAMAILKRQEQQPDPLALQQVQTLLIKAVKIDSTCVDAYLQLGTLYSSQHDYEKAIGFYTKAIALDPKSGEAHYRLGTAYDRTGEQAKAKEEFALHDEIEKQKAAAVERQRREIKQFLVILQGQTTHPTVQ